MENKYHINASYSGFGVPGSIDGSLPRYTHTVPSHQPGNPELSKRTFSNLNEIPDQVDLRDLTPEEAENIQAKWGQLVKVSLVEGSTYEIIGFRGTNIDVVIDSVRNPVKSKFTDVSGLNEYVHLGQEREA